MAGGKQGNQQNAGRQNGGVQQQASEAARAVREGVDQAGQRIREGYESAAEGVQRGYRSTEGMIARNPAPSVLIGFGVGFGLGLALVTMLGREETWAERHIPDSVRSRIPRSFQKTMRNAPDNVHHLVDQVTESLRNLPDAIARAMPSSISGR